MNINNNGRLLATTMLLLVASMTFSPAFAYDIGTGPPNSGPVSDSSLTLNDNGFGSTFSGKGGYSADGIGTTGSSGLVQVDIPAGSTIESAYLYASTYTLDSPFASVSVELDDVPYTLAPTPLNTYDGCCGLQSFKYTGADVKAQVAAKYASDGPGVFDFTVEEISPGTGNTDGVALVVIYSNPTLPFRTIAVMDGSLATAGETTLIGLSEPLDKTIPGFDATLALGIGFSYQGVDGNACGGINQKSSVSINAGVLSSCAGNYDDGEGANGALFTVGGVSDDTTDVAGVEDELYNLSPFLAQGDTLITMDTANTSADDLIFLSILSITAKATVGEICGDGIDNDNDGTIDEGCDTTAVAGELLPLNTTSLFISGLFTNGFWMVPAVAGIAGAGVIVIRSRMHN
jgi:hypothetical protein